MRNEFYPMDRFFFEDQRRCYTIARVCKIGKIMNSRIKWRSELDSYFFIIHQFQIIVNIYGTFRVIGEKFTFRHGKNISMKFYQIKLNVLK